MYILLYDGQCLICRNLIKLLENKIQAEPYQNYSDKIKFLEKEIHLYNTQTKTYLGGIEAIKEVLEITGKWPFLKNLLKFSFLNPIYTFIYRLIALHRYTWFIIPAYLRCAACELEIPKIWNIIFFIFFGFIILISSFFNLFLLFQKINLVILILFFNIIIFSQTSFTAFALYIKTLGINKIEACKQYIFISALVSIGLLFLNIFLLPFSFLFKALVLALSLPLASYFIFKRWQQIGFLKSKLILILDCTLKLFVSILILFIKSPKP